MNIQICRNVEMLNAAFFIAKTRTTQILVQEMLFADDSAVVAHSAGDIQSGSRRTVTQFSLKINIKKTECNTQGEGPCSSNEEFKSHTERILEKTRSRMWTFSTLRGLTAGDDDDDSKRLFVCPFVKVSSEF